MNLENPILTPEEAESLENRNLLSGKILECVESFEKEIGYKFSRAERDAVFLDLVRWNNMAYLKKQYDTSAKFKGMRYENAQWSEVKR